MSGSNKVQSMSMRQQILYIMQMSEQNQNWDNNDEVSTNNFNEKFEIARFKMREKDLQSKRERWRMLAASMSEFVPIKKNRYLERPKQVLMPKDYPSLQCSCKPAQNKALLADSSSSRARTSNANALVSAAADQSYDCGDLCLNKSVNQDCIPQVCPVGKEACRNRKFTLHQNAYVYPVKTQSKGWGLSAGEKIFSGQFVMQYVGEVFYEDSPIGEQRIEKYKNSTCTYMMKTENGEVIDPTFYGNIARFINHSCDPNCVTRKWTVERETMIGIFAIRDIQEDEELSFDYQFDSFKTPYTKCYCGTHNCKGYLGLGLYEDMKDNKNAPQCKICSKLVEKEHHLVVCRGGCRGVYHMKCVAKKDASVRGDPSFSRQNYTCKACEKDKRKKSKIGQSAANHITNKGTSLTSGVTGSPQKQSQTELVDGVGVGSDEIMEESQPSHIAEFPVHTDPYCLEFATSSEQNQLLDKIIEREIYQIDLAQKNTYIDYCPGVVPTSLDSSKNDPTDPETPSIPQKDSEETNQFVVDGSINASGGTASLGKKSKKKRLQISAFYSFHFELCRRLKLRMKENRGTFKFRKVYTQVRGNAGNTTEKAGKIKQQVLPEQKRDRNKSASKSLKKVSDLPVYTSKQQSLTAQGAVQSKNVLPKKDSIGSKAQISDTKTKSQKDATNQEAGGQKAQSITTLDLLSEKQDTSAKNEVAQPLQATTPVVPIQEKQDSILSSTTRVLTGRMKRFQRAASQRQASVISKAPSCQLQNLAEPQNSGALQNKSPSKIQIKVPILVQENLTPLKTQSNKVVDQEMKIVSPSSKISSSKAAGQDEISIDDEEETELDLCDETSSSDDEEESQESQEAESSEEDFADQKVKANSLLQDQESVIVGSEKYKGGLLDQQDNLATKSQKKISKEAKKAAIKAGINPSQLETLSKTKLTFQQEKDMQSLDESLLQKKRGRPSKSDLQIRHLLQIKLARQIVKENGLIFQISGKDQSSNKQFPGQLNMRQQSRTDQPFKVTRDQKHTGPEKPMILFSSQQARREKTLKDIEGEIESKVQKFVDQEIEKEDKVLEIGGKVGETRSTKFNVYKILFDLVIGRNIELFQCVQSLEITWDNAWAGLVTLKIVSTLQQFNGFLEILQTAIDLLLFGKLLTVPIGQQTQSVMRRLNEGECASSVMPFFIMTIHVPKVFLKKLVGYQEKVLLALKQEFEVDFVYDENLVTDIVYQHNETTPIRIFGKGRDVVKVCCQLQMQLEQLQIKTLSFSKEESKFVLLHIKEIKVKVNPCEIRVRLTNQNSNGTSSSFNSNSNKYQPSKDEEIKHPIFCTVHYSRDVCLIGTEKEIKSAEQLLWDFFATKVDSPNLSKVSVCFLLPTYLRGDIYEIQQKVQGDFPNLYVRHYMPQYPRKHITLYVYGPWRTLLLVSRSLAAKTDHKFRMLNQPAYRSFEEFQEFTWHTQLRQNLKNLMRIELDNQTGFLTHWDTTSNEIERAMLAGSQKNKQQMDDGSSGSQQISDTERLQKFVLSADMKLEIVRAFQDSTTKETVDGKQNLEDQNPSQNQIITYFNRLQAQKEQRLVNYLCQIDQESCLNALFALSDMDDMTLEKLFEGLSLKKRNFVRMSEQTISAILRKLNCPSFYSYESDQMSKMARSRAIKIQQEDQSRSRRDQSVHSTSQRNNNDDSRILNETSPCKSYLQSNVTEKESVQRKRSRSRSRSPSQIGRDQINVEEKLTQKPTNKDQQAINRSEKKELGEKPTKLTPQKQQSVLVKTSTDDKSPLENLKGIKSVENLSESGTILPKEVCKEEKKQDQSVVQSSKQSVADSQNPLGRVPLVIKRSQRTVKEEKIPISGDLPKDASELLSNQESEVMPAKIMTEINAEESPQMTVIDVGQHLAENKFEEPQITNKANQRQRVRSRSRERSIERNSTHEKLNDKGVKELEILPKNKADDSQPKSPSHVQSQSGQLSSADKKPQIENKETVTQENTSSCKDRSLPEKSASDTKQPRLASGQGFYQSSRPRGGDVALENQPNSSQNHSQNNTANRTAAKYSSSSFSGHQNYNSRSNHSYHHREYNNSRQQRGSDRGGRRGDYHNGQRDYKRNQQHDGGNRQTQSNYRGNSSGYRRD